MAILTDGPGLEAADKWTATYLQQLEAAHQHQVLVNSAIGVAVVVALIAAWIVVPRLWRRVRAALSSPVRMADPQP